MRLDSSGEVFENHWVGDVVHYLVVLKVVRCQEPEEISRGI